MSEHPSDQTKLRVIYVAGYGRSGSTLLDIALGMRADVFGAGELTALARHAWKNGEYCACGATVRDCPFWSRVMVRADGDEGSAGDGEETRVMLEELARVQKRMESLAAPRRLLARFMPKSRNRYHSANAALFRAVGEQVGHEEENGEGARGEVYILDSSKLPGRALALASMPGIDLHVIHLVRDPRAVAWSMSRRHAKSIEAGVQRELRPKPAAYVALRWVMVNLVCEWLCRRLGKGRTIRVRYEDFVADPEAVLEAIRSRCAPQLASTVQDGTAEEERAGSETLHPGHQVAGSRHRMQSGLVIREDHVWQRQMPDATRRIVTRLTGPLLRRYGYVSGTGAGEEGRSPSSSRTGLVGNKGMGAGG
ncbi:sulfotransferase family protein [Novosphingobium sp. PhB165]|uniref:sulfotransferase family protein n=1 Tax=Novosphingobium sp. PhB165 TaxID=2485105 RepID=UPI0010DC6B1D|nr:sulfotransferase [Novosphingobium sp. PhB165]TCM21368.1 sulfotransferase family protein [Novosphingobium sp. PhB165]